MLIDTHAHLNFAAYKDDLDEVVGRIQQEEMKVINVGSQLSTSQRAIELAEKYSTNFYVAIGLHPIHLFATEVDESEIPFHSRQEDFSTEKYQKLAESPRVVAIGEMGIDYFHVPAGIKKEDFEHKQKWTFIKGIQLAKKLNLPMILHCRGAINEIAKAYDDMLEVLKQENYNKAVVHCFSADWPVAKKFLDEGFMISFTGIITYPKTKDLEKVVKKTPMNKLMVETDAPYLKPRNLRPRVKSHRNEPRWLPWIVGTLAAARGEHPDYVAERTTENARAFFRLPALQP